MSVENLVPFDVYCIITWLWTHAHTHCKLVCVCLWFAVNGDVLVHPTHYEATVGEDVTIDCIPISTSNETENWLKQNNSEETARLITNTANGKVLNGFKNKYSVEKLDAGGCRLNIRDVQPSDEGMFICREGNDETRTANMTLKVTGMLQ